MKGLSHVLWLYGEDHELTEVGIMNIMMFYINDNGGKISIRIYQITVGNDSPSSFRKRAYHPTFGRPHPAWHNPTLCIGNGSQVGRIQSNREENHHVLRAKVAERESAVGNVWYWHRFDSVSNRKDTLCGRRFTYSNHETKGTCLQENLQYPRRHSVWKGGPSVGCHH
jgi:hypothetical protein